MNNIVKKVVLALTHKEHEWRQLKPTSWDDVKKLTKYHFICMKCQQYGSGYHQGKPDKIHFKQGVKRDEYYK